MSHLTTTAPSYVAAWKRLDTDTATALHTAVTEALTATDGGDVESLATLHAATYLPGDVPADLHSPEAIRKAGRAAVRSARRRAAVLVDQDAPGTSLADLTDPDVLAAVESALAAMPHGRLTVGHHGPADQAFRYGSGDLFAIRLSALPEADQAAIRRYLAADTGRPGRRPAKPVESARRLTMVTTHDTVTATGDPDPVGDPHPRHGRLSAGAWQTTRDHQAFTAVESARPGDRINVTHVEYLAAPLDYDRAAMLDRLDRRIMRTAAAWTVAERDTYRGRVEYVTDLATARRHGLPEAWRALQAAHREYDTAARLTAPAVRRVFVAGTVTVPASPAVSTHVPDTGTVRVRYADGRPGTARRLTDREAAAIGQDVESLPSSLPGNGNDDTARGLDRNEDGTVPSRKPVVSPRKRAADNGPTVTGSPSRLGMTH